MQQAGNLWRYVRLVLGIAAGFSSAAFSNAPASANACRAFEAKLDQCVGVLDQCQSLAVSVGQQRDALNTRLADLQRGGACPQGGGAAWMQLVRSAVDQRLDPVRARAVGCERFVYELADPPVLKITGQLRDLSDAARRIDEVKRALPGLTIEQAGLKRLEECLKPIGEGYGLDTGGPIERVDIAQRLKSRMPSGQDCETLGRRIDGLNDRDLADVRTGAVGFWVRETQYDSLCRKGSQGWQIDRTNLGSQSGVVIVRTEGVQ